MSQTETISEAFDLIRQYAVREGWIPIGFRSWTVGPWRITMNGTKQKREDIPPYHALIEHMDIVLDAAVMVINPFGGTVVGWAGAEDVFIAAMQAELQGQPT